MKKKDIKTIIISAVNLFEGGGLTVLRECLRSISEKYSNRFKIIAIVNNRNICKYSGIEYVEIPWSRKLWIGRIFCEYLYFKYLSKKLNPYLWFSLHDITPNVYALKRVVYCHNPAIFLEFEAKYCFDYKIFLFSLFYKYLYKLNIKKNNFVIVQSNWMREEFANIFNLEMEKIIVARPNTKKEDIINNKVNTVNNIYQFFYPAYPRPFKNLEVVCEAVEIITRDENNNKFEVMFTIEGFENKYAKLIYNKYKNLKQINFLGLLSRDKVLELYNKIDCLIFSSKLETWGLPISEFSIYQKPMLLADLKYAHETAEGSNAVGFFNPNCAQQLAEQMKLLMNGNTAFLEQCPVSKFKDPFADSWDTLFSMLLE